MLAAIRAFAKSWVAAVLIGLLIVSFAVFGIRDVFKGQVADAVVTAGSRTLTSADFKREFDAYRQRMEQQAGQPITPQIIDANALDRGLLNALAGREAFAALIDKIGIRPSDALIAGQIQKIPAFFDQVTGRFDKKSYQQKLGENGLTPVKFEAVMRDGLAQEHLGAGVAAGLVTPRAYTALAAIYALEGRDIDYFGVEPQSVPQPTAPTDAQLTSFMTENASHLQRPEFRVLTVVRFSPELVGASLPVDPAELKKRYDFRKDTLSTPQTRTIVQIPAKDPASAVQIAARLAKGEAPAVIAKGIGVEALTYDNKPQSAIADRKVGAAAFAMSAGQIAPVQGDLGVAVVKVVAVTPGHTVTLEEARPALEAEIRKDAAAEKVYALTQAYDDAHQGGANLAQSAAKANVPAITIGAVSREGRNPQGQPVPGLTQKLMETAWALPAGGESEVEDTGSGEFFAVRVEKVIPSAMMTLEEIRPQLTQAWMQRALLQAMQTRATAFAARVSKGESLEAVAASTGVPVAHVVGISRQSASQNPQLSQDMLGRAFAAKPGEVFTAQNSHFGLVVAKLAAVRSGDPAQLAAMAQAARPQMSGAMFRELNETAVVAARQKIKVTLDINRARAVLGLDPLDPKTTSGKATATGGKAQ